MIPLNKVNDPDSNKDNEYEIGGTFSMLLAAIWNIAGVKVTNLSTLAARLNGLDSVKEVANKSGSPMVKGALVYISGYDTTLGAPIVSLADADDATKKATLVLTEAIADNASGSAEETATVATLNTDAFSAVGDLVYESATAGEWTETAPTDADDDKRVVGVIKVKSATIGEIYFFPGMGGLEHAAVYLNNLVAGTAKANGAMVLDASKDIAGINTLGIADITDFVKFLGINDIIGGPVDGPSVGTWAKTRIAKGDYVNRKTAADETAIIGIDITEVLRTTASKGFKLSSFDYIFRNITADLDAHTVTLSKIDYIHSEVVAITDVPVTSALTGILLGVAQDNDPQITNVVVDTPAFNVTNDSKYVIEATVDASAGSVYDFIGIMLKFTKNDL